MEPKKKKRTRNKDRKTHISSVPEQNAENSPHTRFANKTNSATGNLQNSRSSGSNSFRMAGWVPTERGGKRRNRNRAVRRSIQSVCPLFFLFCSSSRTYVLQPHALPRVFYISTLHVSYICFWYLLSLDPDKVSRLPDYRGMMMCLVLLLLLVSSSAGCKVILMGKEDIALAVAV